MSHQLFRKINNQKSKLRRQILNHFCQSKNTSKHKELIESLNTASSENKPSIGKKKVKINSKTKSTKPFSKTEKHMIAVFLIILKPFSVPILSQKKIKNIT
jgi:hypothetical protein